MDGCRCCWRQTPCNPATRHQGPPLIALGLMAALCTAPAWGSSPAAWAAYGQQVQAACLKASGLRQARPAGDRLDLPGPNGSLISALMLRGRMPQPGLAQRSVLELCLYDAKRQQARIGDAERLLSDPQQQPQPRTTP